MEDLRPEYKMTDKSFVFIIGAPRSGTTWVQRMLGDHPQVCTSGELKLYSSYIAPWLETWEGQVKLQQYGDFTGLPTVFREEDFLGYVQDFIARVYARVVESKPETSIILDKNPWYSEYVEVIDRFHPEAKFIHVIRDGRDVATSLMAASRGWGEVWAPRSVEAAAAKWKRQVLAAKTARRFGEDRYMEVRYEDLLSDGKRLLDSIFRFVGLPATEQQIEALLKENRFDKMAEKKIAARGPGYPEGFFRKGRSGDWIDSLAPMQRYRFHQQAGDLLMELGYAADPSWWSESFHERLTLPFAAFFSKKHFSRIRDYFGASKTVPNRVQP